MHGATLVGVCFSGTGETITYSPGTTVQVIDTTNNNRSSDNKDCTVVCKTMRQNIKTLESYHFNLHYTHGKVNSRINMIQSNNRKLCMLIF